MLLQDIFTNNNGLGLFWIIVGILALYFLSILPVIVKNKKLRKQRNKQAQSSSPDKQWMMFLSDTAQKQKSEIKDIAVSDAWEMFLECVEVIQNGYGNWGGRVNLDDIYRLILLIKSNKIWGEELIGEDLFWIGLQPDDQLEVGLTSQKITCKASLMLNELESLWQNLQKYEGMKVEYYSVETFRKDLKEFCKSFPNDIAISDTGTTFYLSDTLAYSVPVIISIPQEKSIAVVVRKSSREFLLKDNRVVWVLNQESGVVEEYSSDSEYKSYAVKDVFGILKGYATGKK